MDRVTDPATARVGVPSSSAERAAGPSPEAPAEAPAETPRESALRRVLRERAWEDVTGATAGDGRDAVAAPHHTLAGTNPSGPSRAQPCPCARAVIAGTSPMLPRPAIAMRWHR